jgi:hypothetical protein
MLTLTFHCDLVLVGLGLLWLNRALYRMSYLEDYVCQEWFPPFSELL